MNALESVDPITPPYEDVPSRRRSSVESLPEIETALLLGSLKEATDNKKRGHLPMDRVTFFLVVNVALHLSNCFMLCYFGYKALEKINGYSKKCGYDVEQSFLQGAETESDAFYLAYHALAGYGAICFVNITIYIGFSAIIAGEKFCSNWLSRSQKQGEIQSDLLSIRNKFLIVVHVVNVPLTSLMIVFLHQLPSVMAKINYQVYSCNALSFSFFLTKKSTATAVEVSEIDFIVLANLSVVLFSGLSLLIFLSAAALSYGQKTFESVKETYFSFWGRPKSPAQNPVSEEADHLLTPAM